MDQLSLKRDKYGLNYSRCTQESTYCDNVSFILVEDIHDSIREFHYEPRWVTKDCASGEVVKARELNELSSTLLELYFHINGLTNAIKFIRRQNPSLDPFPPADAVPDYALDIGERYRPDFSNEKLRLENEVAKCRQQISKCRRKMKDLVRRKLHHNARSTMFSIHAPNWPLPGLQEKFFFRLQTPKSAVLFNEDGFFCTKAKSMVVDFENDPISESNILSHLDQESADLSPYITMTQEPGLLPRLFNQIGHADREATTVSIIDSKVLNRLAVPFESIKDILTRMGGGLECIACSFWVAHCCIPKEAVKMTLSMSDFQSFLDKSRIIGVVGSEEYVLSLLEEDTKAEVAVRASSVRMVDIRASPTQIRRR